MSMMACVVMAQDGQLEQLLEDPDGIDDFLDEEPTTLELEKAWHGLHWLLTGSADGGDPPLCFLLMGGEPVGDVDMGYGPARALSSELVARWSAALSAIAPDELAERFDAQAMVDAEIYPGNWLNEEVDELEYLMQAFESLREFVSKASEKRSGLLVYLS